MQLSNPFPQSVIVEAKTNAYCWLCGGNGSNCGGLEANHITGRDSSSRLNLSILCKDCHSTIGHNAEEEMYLTNISIIFWYNKGYKWKDEDVQHLQNHPRLLRNNPILTYEI